MAGIPAKMKAVVVTAFGKPLQIRQVDVPKPTGHDILVDISYSGLCGSDHHFWLGEWGGELSRIPGHEGVGRVVAVGDAVDAVSLGDMVGIPYLHDTCRTCESCLDGWESLCEDQRANGWHVDGTLAEYALADSRYVTGIPKNVDPAKAAPVLCAGLTVYKGLKLTRARPGQWVAICGVGGLGQLAILLARAMGYRVVAVDISDAKLQLARKLGAEHAFNGRSQDVGRLVREAVGGVHACVVAATSTAAYTQALTLLRIRGTLVMIGLPDGSFPVHVNDTASRGLTIRGSVVGDSQDMKEVLELYASHNIPNIVDIEPVENVNRIMGLMDKGELRGRVVFDLRRDKSKL